MKTSTEVELFLDTLKKEKFISNKKNLLFKLNSLFEGINFKNKRVLDIGGGNGIYSFFAACSGAKEVICLEPEIEGSSSRMTEKFLKMSRLLKYTNVTLKPVTLQNFESESQVFDIILLHNSINHLDENACINLLNDSASRLIYHNILLKISSLTKKGGRLIICDCSRYNLFSLLGIPNPLALSIEWHKHQAPEVWSGILNQVGFKNSIIKWTTFKQLRHIGKLLLGNKVMAYLLCSHFCLTMEKN